jgi:hypothetical protein
MKSSPTSLVPGLVYTALILRVHHPAAGELSQDLYLSISVTTIPFF